MANKGAAIIPAAGSGSRMKASCPKQYLDLCGRPVLIHTVAAFYTHRQISIIIVAVPEDQVESTRMLLADHRLESRVEVIAGGIRRQDSVKAGLDHLDSRADVVLVHDGARPLVSHDLISSCLNAAERHGAAIAAIPVKDTLKRGDASNTITATVDRTDLWQAQTPQAAKASMLMRAFEHAGEKDVTDEASLLELAGYPVRLVEGNERNIKITRPEDLIIAEKLIMQTQKPSLRIGHGFDAHRLVKGRDLVLGGVTIDHSHGLAGHSDADVVTHALCDAILGALGLGDIGKHFPDSSDEFKDIYSIILLQRVVAAMKKEGGTLGNADITIVCQQPKLAPHIEKMAATLAAACDAEAKQINVKATTTEKMGYTGRGEGIACHAVVILEKQTPR